MNTTKTNHQSKIPKLRFRGFEGEWEEKCLGKAIKQKIREVPKPNIFYMAIGIRSHFKGTFQKPNSDPSKIAMEKLFVVKEGDFIVNITFAWEGALAIVKKEDDGGLVSHRFPTYVFNEKIINKKYFQYVFSNKKMKYMLGNVSPGGAGRNRVLNKKDFLKLKLYFPNLSEQQKIADFLCSMDAWIENLTQQKQNLETYKKGMMQKIFSQEIRFRDDNGKDFPEWTEKMLGEALDYEQPTNYIVKSTEYNNSYKTPVLTAGKGFILGYTNEVEGIHNLDKPVIIFDDFTTATQFVDFPFKVKSSAMKILKVQKGFNIKFIFEVMQNIRFEVGGHGRHWISIFSNLVILFPSISEQQRIADFLASLDKKIEAKKSEIEKTENWKKGLMQGLFV